jgi:hypothetical protein
MLPYMPGSFTSIKTVDNFNFYRMCRKRYQIYTVRTVRVSKSNACAFFDLVRKKNLFSYSTG